MKNRDANGRFIKGHRPTPEMIEKDRIYHTGKKHTEESKLKISRAKKGTTAWNKDKKMPNRSRSLHHNWEGGRCTDKLGYVYIHSPDHPHKNKRGYVFEHRLVMEKSINRVLEVEEVVHHINGIRDDNRISNLRLISSHSEHMKEHYKERSKDGSNKFTSYHSESTY